MTTTQGVAVADASGALTISNASVTVNKSFSPTTVAVGGTSTMSIQIRNNNAGAINLTGVGLTDNLPAGMVVANPPAPTTSGCTAAPAITAVNGAATVTLANGSVNANTICTVNVTVKGTVSGNLINNIPPSAVSSTQGVTNPLQGTATLAATGTIKLTVTKTNGVASVVPGGTTTYTIGVSNAGPNDVAGLVINDPPPPGVTFGVWTCVATGGAFCGTGSGPIVDIVTIPNGGSITYTVPATIAPNVVGTVTNTVTAIVPGSVINTGGTTATDADPVAPVTSLAITKDDGSPTYLPGGNAVYVMILTNGGPSDATNVGDHRHPTRGRHAKRTGHMRAGRRRRSLRRDQQSRYRFLRRRRVCARGGRRQPDLFVAGDFWRRHVGACDHQHRHGHQRGELRSGLHGVRVGHQPDTAVRANARQIDCAGDDRRGWQRHAHADAGKPQCRRDGTDSSVPGQHARRSHHRRRQHRHLRGDRRRPDVDQQTLRLNPSGGRLHDCRHRDVQYSRERSPTRPATCKPGQA